MGSGKRALVVWADLGLTRVIVDLIKVYLCVIVDLCKGFQGRLFLHISKNKYIQGSYLGVYSLYLRIGKTTFELMKKKKIDRNQKVIGNVNGNFHDKTFFVQG